MASKLSKIMHVSPMLVTLKHVFKKAVTVQYPEEKLEIPRGFRGLHVYDVDKCMGCGACAMACPNKCIELKVSTTPEGKKKIDEFNINLGRCMFCGLCVDYCIGKGVLRMTTEYEYSGHDRESLIYGIDRLVREEEVEK
ncbi:MAG: NADH-quinone oxidoreductase subunit I [Candidatus Hydrothermarchaeaceae archaeon]